MDEPRRQGRGGTERDDMRGMERQAAHDPTCAEHHDPVPVVLAHGPRRWVVVTCGICGSRL